MEVILTSVEFVILSGNKETDLEKAEGSEEKKVAADDEIMELATPEDEAETGEQNPETEEEY